jgi:immune inhibitor A
MRRVLLGAALGALLTILVAAPAGAVPANEVLIAKNLQRLGVVPSYATPAMARAAAHALAATGTQYPVKPAVGKAAQSEALGRYLSARVVAGKGASAYATNALVLLVEFGSGAWPDGDSTGHSVDGPVHGQIMPPAPDDNATFWPGDFSPMHYQQMLFGNSYPIYGTLGLRTAGAEMATKVAGANGLAFATQLRGTSDDTMRNYYLEQSHGAYTVQGDIKDWVTLDLPESYYGADSDPWNSSDDLTGPVWRVARDAIVRFAENNPGFDWGRYDQENPWGITGRDFDRPDGYLDHLILIHAGSDQSAGGGAQESDAIWAHSWGIYENYAGGPGDGPGMMIPGTDGQGPQGLGIWAYNYTINPEDGDVGVFCHEFGHDLGLPDEYDYSSATGDATSGFWTIMASGSWLGRQWGIGTKPAAMNVWDKSALGFVQPKVVKRGRTATVRLEAAATGSADATGVKIELPKATHTTTLSGRDGAGEWYSTMGNGIDVVLDVRDPVEVGPDTDLSYRTWYDIERDYDYGWVLASADGGDTWDTLKEYTGSDTDRWADVETVDLSAYEGESILIRFEYMTDGGVALKGWEVSDVAIEDVVLPASAFSSDGWIRVDGEWKRKTDRYYIAEYRTYDGFDESLKNCYQWNYDYDNWVDWFSYNKGLHLIYRDTFYMDNDVSTHVGRGGWMVVDSHPMPAGVAYSDGADDYLGFWRPRIQVRDASFSLKPTQTQSIYFVDYDQGWGVAESTAPGRAAQPKFNDARTYWYDDAPEAGVKIPRNLGVRVVVKSMRAETMTVHVDNVK